MSNFLDKMKHLVVEDDPNAAQPEPAAQPQSKPQSTSRPTAPTGIPGLGLTGIPGLSSSAPVSAPQQAAPVFHPTGAAPAPDANLTQTYVAKLREKFATSPYNAILTQFTGTMDSLSEDLPQEGSRFRAALKVMQSTPDKLTDAFTSLLGVLDKEYQGFQTSLTNKKAQTVDAREQQVQQINDQIIVKNNEIQALMASRDGIATDIIQAKTELGATAASFEGAVAALQAEVSDSLQKLKIYFPASTTTAAAKK